MEGHVTGPDGKGSWCRDSDSRCHAFSRNTGRAAQDLMSAWLKAGSAAARAFPDYGESADLNAVLVGDIFGKFCRRIICVTGHTKRLRHLELQRHEG